LQDSRDDTRRCEFQMERRQDPRVWGLSRLCRWSQALLRLQSCFRRGLGGPAWCHHLATAITSTSCRTSTSFVVKFSQVPVGWHVSELGHRSVEPSPPEGAPPRLLKGGNDHLLEGSGAGRAVAAASPRESSRLLRPLRPTWAAESPSSRAPRLMRMVGDGAGRLGAVTHLRRLRRSASSDCSS